MQNNHCPTCHASIPPNAPGGFCPACLLRDAEELPSYGHKAPPLEEIASAFPQLEVLELIGLGGMGFVYKVRQPSLDRIVALKILSPELSRDPAFAERFAREARTLGKLQHPNIVTVFEHGESGGLFYLMMEYVDGVNLRQAMRAGRFTPEQALTIVPGICDALQAAHAQGIWHRDIKPENILLDREGKVKIADFGIARIVGDPQGDFTLTRTGNALGSTNYMAPEQHEKPHEVDHRADIYSLGVVIYEMLTGELPLGRFPAPSQRAAVDARIDEIVFKTLEKERDLRQQSANEVKTEMHCAMQPGATGKARPEKASSSPKAGLAKLSFGLFLAGFFAFPLIAAFAPVPTVVAIIGALALLLLAFVFGLFSWPEFLAKIVVITTGALLLIGLGLWVVSLPFFTLKTPISGESPSPSIPTKAAVSGGGQRSVEEAHRKIPDVTVEEVFHKVNAAANESNGEEFDKYMGNFYEASDPVADAPGSDARNPQQSTLRNMKYFLGELVNLRIVSIERQRLKYNYPDPPLQGVSPVAYATIRRSDGTLSRLAVSFHNRDGKWQGEQAWFPNFSAYSRISFKPEKGDAFSMLETHLDSTTDFRAVKDKPGIFDVFGYDSDADDARQNADSKVVELRESLDEFDLGKHLKVVTPAEKPELPYMGEREPPFEELK